MFNFLKICGMGLLAVLLSPLWIGLLAIVAVFGLFLFIFMLIRMLYLDLRNFFVKDKSKVKDPFGDLSEDLEVKRLLKAQEAVVLSQQAQVTIPTSVSSEHPIVIEEQNAPYIENTVPFVPVEEKKEEIEMEEEEKEKDKSDFIEQQDEPFSSSEEGDEQ